jgi:hypothetical protein
MIGNFNNKQIINAAKMTFNKTNTIVDSFYVAKSLIKNNEISNTEQNLKYKKYKIKIEKKLADVDKIVKDYVGDIGSFKEIEKAFDIEPTKENNIRIKEVKKIEGYSKKYSELRDKCIELKVIDTNEEFKISEMLEILKVTMNNLKNRIRRHFKNPFRSSTKR